MNSCKEVAAKHQAVEHLESSSANRRVTVLAGQLSSERQSQIKLHQCAGASESSALETSVGPMLQDKVAIITGECMQNFLA